MTGISSTSSSPLDPSSGVLFTLAEKLQEAFTSGWSNLTSTVPNELPNGLCGASPPLPSIGQVNLSLNGLTPDISASIEQITYPMLFKHALVSPVPKVSYPTCINSDYSQISVLAKMAKILERMQLQLNGKPLAIRHNQYAFTENRSTVSALADITQSWFNSTDNTVTWW